jgi:lysophospholipase L1-like esterase
MNRSYHAAAARLLRVAALAFLVAGLLCSPWLVGKFDPTPPVDLLTARALPAARVALLGIGVAVLAFAELVAPAGISRFLSRLFDKPVATKLLLAFLTVCVPLVIAELGLRPFTIAHVQKKGTNLFMHDPELGWRLRPRTRAFWGDAEVTINSKGLRGPAVPYPRQPTTPRILYLGDSVTFGYRLADYAQGYPFRIEALLEDSLGRDVETVNAGVGGYSPWQERIFLEQEGLKYRPDLIILGFVLNDVTEKFDLIQFGGTDVGSQAASSYLSVDDWLRHNSALYMLLQRVRARRQFGPDVREGAVAREDARVEDLATSPDSPAVRHAWSVTLENLDGLAAVCEANRLPLAIVVFPFQFQFGNVDGLSAPQRKLTSWCESKGVPCLDLLPLLADYMQSHGKPSYSLFLDDDHLSARGCDVVAGLVVSWLHSQEPLWARIAMHPAS